MGKALVIETRNSNIPYVIAAPTMRVPMSFNIATGVNAYLAMKAALLAAKQHGGIHHIAISGLCTTTGRMKPDIAARQMYFAYREVELGQKMDFKTSGEAQKYQLGINPESMIWDF